MLFDRYLVLFLIFFLLGESCSAGLAAPPPRMRPYTGIGLVVFSNSVNASRQELQLQLYEEPGLSRAGMLNSPWGAGNDWIFDLSEGTLPLIVSSYKGGWLRVFYDDAGREAWIYPENDGRFQSWEQYLKLRTGRMLPGLQQQYYQLQQQSDGKVFATLTPKQVFKVLKLENDRGLVLTDQSQIGWIRWRDNDGRLTIGTGKKQ